MNETCYWREDANGNHDTECGEKHTAMDHDVEEDDFCPFCGKEIDTTPPSPTREEIEEEKADRWLQERKDMDEL